MTYGELTKKLNRIGEGVRDIGLEYDDEGDRVTDEAIEVIRAELQNWQDMMEDLSNNLE